MHIADRGMSMMESQVDTSEPAEGGPLPLAGLPEASVIGGVWNVEPQTLAKLLGLVYAVGFVVVNVHHAYLGPWMPDLLDATYVAAGALASVFTLPFLVSGYFLSGASQGVSGKLPPTYRLRAKYGGVSAVAFAGGILIGALVLRFAGTQDDVEPWLPFFAYGGLVTVAMSLACKDVWSVVRKSDRTRAPGVMMRLIILPAFVCIYFPFTLFPEVNPAFGGGAGWRATIQASGEEVLIIRTDGALMTYLRCIDGDVANETAIWGSPARFVVNGFRSPYAFRRLCSGDS